MGNRGFTLVEVLIAMGVLAFVTLSIATGIGAGHHATKALEEEVALVGRGQELLERLLAIPFGVASEGAASGAELNELLDADDDFGTATVHKLMAFGVPEFETPAFPVPGRWRIVIDTDLNGDGDLDDPEEGRSDLLRIQILHEGRLLARTVRFDFTNN